MKRILSLIIVITMLASMLPSVLAETPIPDEELREIAAATYTFAKGGRSDASMETWFERAILDFETDGETTTAVVRKTEKNPVFTSFPEASTNPNDQWAYVGATNGMSSSGTKSTSNGTELPIVEPGSIYLSASTVPGDGWIAFKIKVPATANYEITGLSAYVSKNSSSEMEIYIVPKSEALNTTLTSPVTYGDFSTILSSSKYYAVRENATSFANLGISSDYLVGTANLMGDANAVQDLVTIEGKVTDKKFLFLEADTEYFLFLHNANSKARGMPVSSVTLSEAIPGVTYTFPKGGRSDASTETWLERAILDFETDGETTTAVVRKTEKNPALTSFPEASTNPNEQWAYVGATNGMSSSGTKSTSNGTELPIVEPGSIYLSASTVPGDGWIAFKIKVPATANYEITGLSAYVSKNSSSEMEIYIVPKSEALNTTLTAPATYGDFSTNFSSSKYYVMRENAASFADLGISSDYLMGTANLMGDANTVQDLATVEGKVTDKKLLFLETDTEYFLFLHNANSKARSMPISSITLSEPVPEFDRISVKFNNTVVGSKLSPSVIWIAGNKKLDGKDGVVNFEIKENSEGALLVGRDGNIYARAPGKAILTVSGTLDGITKTVDVEIEVFEDNSYAGANQSYLFYKGAYQESGSEVVVPDSKLGDYLSKEVFMTSTAIDYGTNGRPWALVSAAASKPTNSGTYFNQTSSYLDLSGSMNDWVAFKVKVPAPGKYSIDLSGYNYINNGRAMLYMTPYSSDMNFDSVRENIDSYMSDENFVGEADLNGSLNTVVSYIDVGTFVADKNLDWSAGYAEYLMVVKSASSEISPGKSSVLLHSMKLCGSAGIGTLKNKFDFDAVGIGESASVISATAKNAVGSDFDLSNAYIEYSVAEEDREILELCDDGISFRGLCEGKATVKTLVLTPGQVFVGEDEITVADREGILAVYLYSADVAEVGETLDFVTRLELNNKRVVSGGEIQGLTIVSESEPGVLKISDDGKHVIAKKAGAAEVKATVKARGNIYTTASTTIAVSELDAKYPSCFKIDLSRNAYTGDTETQLSELTDYTLARNWAFYKFSGVGSEEPTIELTETQYTTVAWNGVSDTNYLAFKTIFPKAGSYTVKVTGFSNDRSAKLDLFVIPATENNITNLDNLLDVNGEYYFGSADTYREPEEAGITNTFGTKTVPSAGEYIVVFRTASGLAKENNSTYGDKWYPHYIDFINENSLQRAEISSQDNRTEIEPGEKIQLTPVLYGPNDTPLEYDGTAEVIWKTSDANIATVDEDGMLCGANEGEVTVMQQLSKTVKLRLQSSL